MKLLTLSLVILILTGCATLNQEECKRGDWYTLGLNDGLSGQTSGRLSQHQEACSEYGIMINHEQYQAGRSQGLNDYCRLENAFKTGLNGQQYQHVCPPAIDSLFSRYNSAAYQVYQDRTELERIDNELSNKENSLWDKKRSDSDRNRIRNEIRDLDRRRHRLNDDMYQHQRLVDDLNAEARKYR